jgi:Tol biopolymer transport system component
MECTICGATNRMGANFCSGCGASLAVQSYDDQRSGQATRRLPTADTLLLPAQHPPHPSPAATDVRRADAYAPHPNDAPPFTGAAAPSPGQPAMPWRRPRWLLGVAFGLVLLGLLGSGAYAMFGRGLIAGRHDRMLVGFQNRNGTANVYVLQSGQDRKEGIAVAERVTVDGRYASLEVHATDQDPRSLGVRGGFIPDTDSVLLFVIEGDANIARRVALTDGTTQDLLKSRGSFLGVNVFAGEPHTFLMENLSDRFRCYNASTDGKARRLVTADSCYLLPRQPTVVFADKTPRAYTLSAVQLDGSNERLLLETDETVLAHRVSDDLSHIAYVAEVLGDQQLFLVDVTQGVRSEASTEVTAVVTYDFAPQSDALFFIVENDDGDLELHLSGTPDPLVTGHTLDAQFSPDGSSLVYVVGDDDGLATAFVRRMSDGTTVEVVQGQNLRLAFATAADRLLFVEEDGINNELRLYASDLDGSNVQTLIDERDLVLTTVRLAFNGTTLFVSTNNVDRTSNLYSIDLTNGTMHELLSGWTSIFLENASNNAQQLIFSGREANEDDYALYALHVQQGAAPIELDADHDRVENVVFSTDGRSLLYTAWDDDRPAINRVAVSGDEPYETLYDDAFLIDTQWRDRSPFEYMYFAEPVAGSGY